jgi:type 1 glutamine amidotransferase
MKHTTLKILWNSAIVFLAVSVFVFGGTTHAADDVAKPKTLLLIGGPADGHKPATHEYMLGVRIVAKLVANVPGLKTRVVSAGELWKEGPKALAEVDGAVVFLSEGARWTQTDLRRFDALAQLAKRGGGLSVLHWGMGTREAKNIAGFQKLFGGCHGGPDRKFKHVTTTLSVADPKHPITRGLQKTLKVDEEFYYRLKFIKDAGTVHPLMSARIEGNDETVCWAWERPDGGRSFGFSGLHYHRNWREETYRRLVAHGVLWTMKLPIPKSGMNVALDEADFKLPPRKKK